MFPINPYISDVKLTLCTTHEQQEKSKLLIAELMTNEIAAAKIEAFSIEYFRAYDDGEGYECGDSLGSFVELIDRGGGYLKTLKQLRWALCHVACSPRF